MSAAGTVLLTILMTRSERSARSWPSRSKTRRSSYVCLNLVHLTLAWRPSRRLQFPRGRRCVRSAQRPFATACLLSGGIEAHYRHAGAFFGGTACHGSDPAIPQFGRPREPVQCTVTPSDDPDALFGLSAMASAAAEALFPLDEHALVGRTQGKVRSTNLRASSSRKTQIHAGRAVPARHTSTREAKRPRHLFHDRDLRHRLGRLEAPQPCGPALALG